MKKTSTHLVYSTKKVAKQKEARAKEQENASPPSATSNVPTSQPADVAPPLPPRQELVVEVTDEVPPAPVRRQSSTSSRTSSEGGRGSTRSHRTHRSSSASSSSSKKPTRLGEHSVKRLRPSPALLQSDRITVAQCVKTMVEKKTDATLLVDQNGLLTGILTDRDIAFKVVALGKNPKMTRVVDVMTPNPDCVASNASAIDALKKMVSGQFRHLPVADNDKVVGILDIAKCLYEAITKVEQEYNTHSKNLEAALKKMEKHLPSASRENLFEKLREKLFLPTLSAILLDRSPVPVLHPTATALDAAVLMLRQNTSAVMVCNDAEEMIGIFTSKDLMRRVVALNIDPSVSVLSKFMTANPFAARLDTTILETLHTMHNGKFLHVPVFDEDAKLVGLVDVLQATCAIVQQMGVLHYSKNDSVQPLLNQLRESFTANNELTDGEDLEEDEAQAQDEVNDRSVIQRSDNSPSGRRLSWSGSHEGRDSSVLENEPDVGDPTSPEHTEQDRPPDVFVFKLADWNGATHRFTSSAESLKELVKDVQNRLGDYTIRKVHYVDDDSEHVLLFTDTDLKDAVKRARMWGNKYIRLIVLHRISRPGMPGMRALTRNAHHNDNVIGMVYYAAAAAAIAGASFFLSRRR